MIMNQTLINIKLSPANLPVSSTRRVNAMEFTADGELLATGDDEGYVIIYRVNDMTVDREYRGRHEIRCLAWHPIFSYWLILGFNNGDMIHILMNTKDQKDDVFKLQNVPGCIHVLTFRGDGNFLAIGFGHGVSITEPVDTKLQALKLPPTNLEDVRPGIRGVHYTPNKDIIVAFLDHRLGLAIYDGGHPYKLLKKFTMRPIRTLIGGSALSPSGALVAIANMTDGVDWYDVKKRKYSLRSTKYKVGEKLVVDVAFVGEDAVITGHSNGDLVLASTKMLKNPIRYNFLMKKGGTQFIAVGYFRGRLHVAAASKICDNIEVRPGSGQITHPITIITAASGGNRNPVTMTPLPIHEPNVTVSQKSSPTLPEEESMADQGTDSEQESKIDQESKADYGSETDQEPVVKREHNLEAKQESIVDGEPVEPSSNRRRSWGRVRKWAMYFCSGVILLLFVGGGVYWWSWGDIYPRAWKTTIETTATETKTETKTSTILTVATLTVARTGTITTTRTIEAATITETTTVILTWASTTMTETTTVLPTSSLIGPLPADNRDPEGPANVKPDRSPPNHKWYGRMQ